MTEMVEAYIVAIIQAIKDSKDEEYLKGVYTFAVTYPDKSKAG